MALRVCDYCGKIDDRGRHVHTGAVGEIEDAPSRIFNAVLNSRASNDDKMAALRSLQDDTTQIRHIECCAKAGCPTGTCGVAQDGSATPADTAPTGE